MEEEIPLWKITLIPTKEARGAEFIRGEYVREDVENYYLIPEGTKLEIMIPKETVKKREYIYPEPIVTKLDELENDEGQLLEKLVQIRELKKKLKKKK